MIIELNALTSLNLEETDSSSISFGTCKSLTLESKNCG